MLDLFEKMVPVSVQQSLAAYNQRKADLVNRSIAQMREATTLANGYVALNFGELVCKIWLFFE